MATENYGNATSYGSGKIIQGGTHINSGDVINAPAHALDEGPRGGRHGRPLDAAAGPAADVSRSVFVVHGRDDQARAAVFGLLRRLDLRPLEWEPLVRATSEGSPFLGQVVAQAPGRAQAAVVLLTPDDVVMLHPELRQAREDRFELHPALQPRPNVLLELGMVLAIYPRNTIIIEFGELRPVADLNGRNVIRFSDGVSPATALRKIAGRLEEAGCPVDDSGTDWLDGSAFTGLRACRRRPT